MQSRIREDFACRIGNPEPWNCFFRFLFIYSFIFFFWIFGTETNTLYAILTSRFDNAFKYFQFAQPVRDPQFKVRSPIVFLYGCNQHRTCSGLPNKRGGTWWPCFLTSSSSRIKVREIFVFWVLYAFSTLGDDRQLVE